MLEKAFHPSTNQSSSSRMQLVCRWWKHLEVLLSFVCPGSGQAFGQLSNNLIVKWLTYSILELGQAVGAALT